ncbi:hypothetical protein RJ639_004031 [Escallonia herrerae]|uniref:Cytochrome P450 n=1 Tax=Escallonia herrerae TaxID=1293975 RepID=A0AA89AYR1_9ASTE|nr:hypothetical protein RJ639_004031 [Escallonia herrerae]
MDILSLETFLFLFTFIISLHLYHIFLPRKPKSSTTTGFKIYPLLGTLPDFLFNRHRFLEWTTGVLCTCPTSTAVLRRPGEVQAIFTANPSNVEHMLKTNFENYPKGTRFISLVEDFLGRGIFNSDGESWKIQRKTVSYEFNTKSLRNFVMDNVTVEIKTRLVPILKRAADMTRVLDIQDVLERFAFDNICKAAFNVDPGCLSGDATTESEFMQAFEEAATLSTGRFIYVLPFLFRIKKFFNYGSEKRLQKSISTVHEFSDKIIRSRMKERAEKSDEDLLSRLIKNSDNSAEFLRDIVTSFILAGRDTTSAALTWFFWLLSSRPDVQQRILHELETIRASNGKNIGDTFSFDELREMHYLHAAISEALRLYPPVPMVTRACREDNIMPDGTFVGKGWFVTYHAYAMGRMEGIWGKDCREYRPERWLENGMVKQESPFRFPVFNAGLRMCLGKDMAYIQMKSIAAAVIERFEMEVQDKENCPPHPLLSVTLRMKGGLHVIVRERVLSTCPTNTAVFRRPDKVQGVITANPLNVEHMLKTNFENYPKGTRFISLLEDFLGRGIFNSDGEIWKIQRKTASYEFNTKSLRNFVMDNVTVEIKTRLVPILKRAADMNRLLDVQDVLERFAFDNIYKVAFNVDPGCLSGDATAGSEFMQAFEEATTHSSGRFIYAFPFLFRIKKSVSVPGGLITAW